ncbi:hypothetical protein ACFWSF_14815 [Streptomyces sp. NPDC058611]|uniref:hypothetical protein n=1 Tax=unclassified Streptomyces TaxID=2593676 RepID=UPI00365328F1
MKHREGTPAHDPERTSPELPDQGAEVDEHGRAPGAPSRTGTGSSAPPADPDRVEEAEEPTER